MEMVGERDIGILSLWDCSGGKFMFEELAVSTGEHELLLMEGRVCRHACVGWSKKGYGRSGLFVGR